MVKVTTGKEINLIQLDQELGGKGLCIDKNDPLAKVITTADDSNVTQSQLEAAIEAHVAVFTPPTVAEKLAAAGLTIEELKAALA